MSKDVINTLIGFCGSQSKVSKELRISKSAIHSLRTGRYKLTPEKCKLINKKFGIPLKIMRPDIYDLGIPLKKKLSTPSDRS